ncbi:MAG: hypothetical protein H6672_15875 [Anaerolineaceae bacterium]|nr:hypothetical protein [Anaerolineaceae bacterium]
MDNTPPESPEPRRSRARERQERRKQRQQAPAPAPSRSHRQIAPAGGFKMPEIHLPTDRRILYGIGGLLVILVVILALGRFKNDDSPLPPNALWLGTEWTYEEPDEAGVQALAARLRENQIGTVYAWVSWLKDDETWAGRRDLTNNFSEVETQVKTFVQQFKAAYPEAQLFGWLGVASNKSDGTERLSESTVQQAVSDMSQRVIDEFGFDGVFLNVEPVWNGDEGFLDVLRKARADLGDAALIAVAVPPDWSPLGVDIPVPPLIVPGTVWDEEYKQRVALLTDQMAVMAYNSGLTSTASFTAADYELWMAYQVKTFAEAVNLLDTGTTIFIGIPTYPAELPGHDPVVENIGSAIRGIRTGLQEAGDAAAAVRGVAIYADWTTDDTEWAQFKTLWVTP